MRIGRGAVAAMLAAALVAGCSKQQADDQEPETNIVEEAPPAKAEEPPPPAEPALPKLPDPAANIADTLAPDEPPSPDEQMLEDADASGLTSRSAPLGVDDAPSADPVGDLIANDGIGAGR